ncbi:MAG: FAD-binding protein, partial [Lentisphaeria bacterium]|nr:FAD-binding protein [Lentisphaeria bacterium]
MNQRPSCFDRVYDVAIVGVGYAGFAAACALADAGHDVVLTSHDGAAVWESGRVFAPVAGVSGEPLWQQWLAELTARGGAANGFVDGACAEILASHWLLNRRGKLTPLHYVR